MQSPEDFVKFIVSSLDYQNKRAMNSDSEIIKIKLLLVYQLIMEFILLVALLFK